MTGTPVGGLLADITHEIRTPMNGMFGMLDFLLSSELNEDQREAAMMAQAAAEDLLALFNNIIDLPMAEADALSLRQSSFELNSSLKSLLDSISTRARIKDVDIEVRYACADGPLVVSGDIDRLRQVFSNLIMYLSRELPREKILVGAASGQLDDGRITLQVCMQADSAIPAQRDFSDAADSSASSRRFDAGELGLVVCRRLIAMMGGRLEISRHRENGIQIGVSLPFKPGGQSGAENKKPFGFSGKRILVVDDDAVNRRVALQALKELGCDVDIACEGRQALAMHASVPYDLILMDCEMPVMDGFEATAKIRASEAGGSRTPIIAWTARFMTGGAGNLLAGGFDDLVPKPMRRQALQDMLSAWMSPHTVVEEPMEADDESEIAEIREMFGDGFAELAALFRSDSLKRIDALQSAAADKDAAMLAKVAHAFSGSAASIGAPRLSALCKELEMQSRAGKLQDVDERLNAIKKEFARISAKLETKPAG